MADIRNDCLIERLTVCIELRGFCCANDCNRDNSQHEGRDSENTWRLPHILPLCPFSSGSTRTAANRLLPSFILSFFLPITQGVHAHRTKPTELLNFNVVLARSF